ncbi:MAG: MFS transporter [Myxococcota bacterium]|jgi:sugar phosphate permease|nr:MFS transporter [Myxococcota bacterium]
MTSSAAAPRSLRHWQLRIFAATWLAYAGYYFGRKAFYVVKADFGEALELTTTQLGHIGTAYLIGYMLGQFSSAYLGRRLGPKLLLLVGIALSVGCNVAFGVFNGFWTLILFFSVNGMAQGTGWPGCIGSLAFWFKRKQRGSVLGVWSTCYQLGSLAAASLAAFLLGAAGWRWSYFGGAVVLLLAWFAVLLLHPNRPQDVGQQNQDDEEENAGAGDAKPSSSLGWTRDVVVTVLVMGAIYFCIKFLRYALWSWVPFFLQANFSLEGDEAGYLSTVFDVAGFLGVIVAGFLSDRLFGGRRALLSLLMVMAMCAAFGIMYGFGAQSLLIFTLAMGLAGFMLFGPDSLISGTGAIDVGSAKGALVAAGVINGMGSIGPVVQEQVIGWMYELGGQALGPILVLLFAMSMLCCVLMAVLYWRSRIGKATL